MSLDDIVNIQITRETAAVDRAGFKEMLILDPHARFYPRVTWYSNLAAMASAGWQTDDLAYVAASDWFAQSPKPTRVAVGKVIGDTIVVSIDSVQNSTDYIIYIESATPGTPTEFKYTSDPTATQTEIADGLVALINAGSEPMTASNVGDDVQLVNDVAKAKYAVTINSWSLMSVGVPTSAEEPDAALNAIVLEDNTWYGLCYTSRTEADIKTVMDWAETVYKIFGTASDDTNILASSDTTSLAYYAESNSLARSWVQYSANASTEYPEAAWMGKALTFDPDVIHITWAFKTLSSVTVDSITDDQRSNALGKNANIYQPVGGVNITEFGTMGEGEYIDVILGCDWIRARMQENIFSRLVNQPKIPYTDKGIASIEASIKKDLQTGIDVGFLADSPAPVVTVPAAADVDQADKAARLLKNITFSATLAGAIHTVQVTGTVTV